MKLGAAKQSSFNVSTGRSIHDGLESLKKKRGA